MIRITVDNSGFQYNASRKMWEILVDGEPQPCVAFDTKTILEKFLGYNLALLNPDEMGMVGTYVKSIYDEEQA